MSSELDLAAIREALADTLEEIEGLYVYRLYPKEVQQLPCVILNIPERIDYSRTSQQKLDAATYELTVIIGRVDPSAQTKLEGFISGSGDTSIREKLYSNRRLGGVISNMRVIGVNTGLYVIPNGAESYLGADIQVEIMA